MEIILSIIGIMAGLFIVPALFEALAIKAHKRAYGTQNAMHAVGIYKNAMKNTTPEDIAILEKLTK